MKYLRSALAIFFVVMLSLGRVEAANKKELLIKTRGEEIFYLKK